MSKRHAKGAQARASGRTSLRVLLDMDQVLADFEGHFLNTYKQQHPDLPYIEKEDRNTFYISEQYATLSPDLPETVEDIITEEFFFLNLPEIEGGVAAAREMADMEDVEVFICTAPMTFYKYCLHEKYQWVEKHLGEQWLDRMIITKDKTLVHGHVLVDDRLNIAGVCEQPTWEHIVFTANHNARFHAGGKRRLDNWTDGQWRSLIEDFQKRI
ncbi:5'(3')-deoxyribonucleotidase, cytosolic type-like [Haliotis cracherodii]|uniref:5'(3')-deoxyribonucleotidase, cytosolic type-like n=1 Tax=Haliotis cracherodii TaxID=6455 RepID=UPI0039E75F4A